jgi:hypothetical protein
MRRLAAVSASFAVALALSACASSGKGPSGVDDSARFDKFKALAGTWSMGADMGGATVSYRVTSGGSAVLESIFAGTPKEMTTLYTLDNGRLRLTHYCMLGNQPSMAAQPAKGGDVVEFDLDCLGNGDPAHDMHMHHAKFEFLGADHIQAHWTLWKDGKPGDTVDIDLTRAKS